MSWSMLVGWLLIAGPLAGCNDPPQDDDTTSSPVPSPPDESTPTAVPPTTTPSSTPTPETGTPSPEDVDDDGDGLSESSGDCDDTDPDVHPGAEETCAAGDSDCDGDPDDDAVDAPTWYIDYDRDGFGADAYTVKACDKPTGYVDNADDCLDTNATVNPTADERCNGIDDDCDGDIDEADAVDASVWYPDGDGDGYGQSDGADTVTACDAPDGYVATGDDCDDADPRYNPGAAETDCEDAADYNCDGSTGYADQDNDGYPACRDCDDLEPALNPNAAEACDGVDNDCDGTVDEPESTDAGTWYYDGDKDGYGLSDGSIVPVSACAAPTGYVATGGDCDDADPRYNPAAVEDDCTDPNDYNCDGSTAYADADSDGSPACSDCDDTEPRAHPGASETCDGIDNDCDTSIDEPDAGDADAWYYDGDNDGYGDDTVTTTACAAPNGYVASGGDCDDTDPAYNPGATEDDCSDPADYNCDGSTGYADQDKDGFAACEDCDDLAAAVNPSASEACDGIDNDCDNAIDEADAVDPATWYKDADGDGHGNPSAPTAACARPTGYVGSSDDCNDANASAYPGATEKCDGVDNDCDSSVDEGVTPTWYLDNDGDGYGQAGATITACDTPVGYAAAAGDCDDADAAVHPGATAGCDGTDYDCDGKVDHDADGDGYAASSCGGDDCNDANSSSYPGAAEKCDGADNDCDGTVDDGVLSTWYLDYDNDGYGSTTRKATSCTPPTPDYIATGGDCDDVDPEINPAATEVCDTMDNDCDGTVDESDPEIDFSSDIDHCGGCYKACTASAGEAFCDDGECAILSCEPGYYNADGDASNGCEATYNYAVARGQVGVNTCTFSNTWTKVPYNNAVTLTTSGYPVLIAAAKRQFKSGTCDMRGHLTVGIDSTIVQDTYGYGLGSSYECYATASFTTVQNVPAGTHTFTLFEKTENSSLGVCSYGATDSLLVIELTPMLNAAQAYGKSGQSQRNAGTSWAPVPYNNEASITTSGGPLLMLGNKKQYKDDCTQSTWLSFEVDGKVVVDRDNYGVGHSYNCNATAVATWVQPAAAGTHKVRLMERTSSSSLGASTTGTLDSLFVLELEPWMNFAYAQGQGSATDVTTNYGATWQNAPYNASATLSSSLGGHFFVAATKRQYKAGGCATRGYASLKLNGTVLNDLADTGIGSSFECNASAPLIHTLAVDAKSYTATVVERTESSSTGVQTYGTTDSLLMWELNRPVVGLGTSSNPAISCKQIHTLDATRGSGPYYLQTPGGTKQLFCDMSNDGGGWTLVGQFNGGGNVYRSWLRSDANVGNLISPTVESSVMSTIHAVDFAVNLAGEVRLSNSAINRWVKWGLPSNRTLGTFWNHEVGQSAITAAADEQVTPKAYNGQTSSCWQNRYGIMALYEHGGSYPAATYNEAGNTVVNDWCMAVGVQMPGTTVDGFIQNANGWDAPYTEDGWPNPSYNVTSPVISVWLR